MPKFSQIFYKTLAGVVEADGFRFPSPGAGWSDGCQRVGRRAEAFACFFGNFGDVTFAAGTIALCTDMTVGCPGSIPSC
jgi:hypothetical protein